MQTWKSDPTFLTHITGKRFIRSFLLILLLWFIGCDHAGSQPATSNASSNETVPGDSSSVGLPPESRPLTLAEARNGYSTKIVRTAEPNGPPSPPPPDSDFELIRYPSLVGTLPAYLTKDPGDAKQHPAIVWITGGDNNSIGDVWSPLPRRNDQSVSAFREAGIVMMFPSQRGGNDHLGQREGFYGEANDILAATDHLANLPYVDPEQIYLGGHSTGGTMAMIVGMLSGRYRAIFALGPVASVDHYGGDYLYCNLNDPRELKLRSPIHWLNDVESPMYVFEGDAGGNWESIAMMVEVNTNERIQFLKVPGHDHFTVIAPLAELLAEQILAGELTVNQESINGLR